MNTYWTSDLHINHVNILAFCNRPFKDVNHMNEILIQNYNSVVQPEDKCYILGDFAMGPKNLHKGFLGRLNGYKVLIRGNHDGTTQKMLDMGFNEVYLNKLEIVDGLRVYMSHIPPKLVDPYQEAGRTYNPIFTPEPPGHDVWLCGHVHGAWKRKGNVINVGVDVRSYRPVSFKELLDTPQPI